MELMDLLENDSSLDHREIEDTIYRIYTEDEPNVRVEEMQKFFYGAYESIDKIIAFLVSVGFLDYKSRKRTDGREYDKHYYITHSCAEKIENSLSKIPSVKWYFDRCLLIKKYFHKYSGTELKKRQYQYTEYKDISYKAQIKDINERVRTIFAHRFKRELV